MSDSYEVLAPYYDRLGMSEFALSFAPQIIRFAHGTDWVGRKIVDLGCGTGGSVRWYASQGYNITGIDISPSMLAAAQRSIDGRGVALQWMQGDASAVESLHDVDLIQAIDVVNELNSLRDLETFFVSVARGLPAGKLFVFDMRTLEGLHADTGLTKILHNDDELFAIVTGEFEHERQTRTDSYLIFSHDGDAWARLQTSHGRRGFPVQVVTTLLGRAGLQQIALVNPSLEPVQPAAPHCDRVICFAQRPTRGASS